MKNNKEIFSFNTRKTSIYFIVLLIILLFFTVLNIIEFVKLYTIDSSYENIRAALNVLIFFSSLFLINFLILIYILRYNVKIVGDILFLRLIFKTKQYNLNELTNFKSLKYGINRKFVVYFNKTKRTIVTRSEEPLNQILSNFMNNNYLNK